MIYLSYVGYEYAAMNQLQTAIQQFILSKNRMIIDSGKIGKFLDEIINGIEDLNKRFPRCTPLRASFWQPEQIAKYSDYHLSIQEEKTGVFNGITLITFSLYASKN